MKKLLLIAIIIYSINCIGQNNSSVLSNGNWYKFAVDTTGIFKIDLQFLLNLGINTSNINPKNIKIYGNGGAMLPEPAASFRYNDLQENAIYVHGEDDNIFNNGDYVLFYATGPHSWNVNPYRDEVEHQQNIYSDKAYYFLTIGESPGKRVLNAPSITNETPSAIFTEYDDYTFYEKENINLFALGRLWFGETFAVENNQTFTIPFNNAVPGSEVLIKVSAVAQSTSQSTLNVSVNNTNISTLSFPPVANSTTTGLARMITNSANTTATNSFSINLNYNNNGNPSAKAFLNYIEVKGKKY